VRVILSTNGFSIQVSDLDFEYLQRFTWCVCEKHGKVTGVIRASKRPKVTQMSHDVLKRRGIVITCEVDHKDRDVLNNQFENLRPATASQNASNQGLGVNNLTGYKGVSYCKTHHTFVAQIQFKGLRISLGRFHDPTKAAKAYDAAAAQYFGDFAVLNFPELA
jgi:hypothetical protein